MRPMSAARPGLPVLTAALLAVVPACERRDDERTAAPPARESGASSPFPPSSDDAAWSRVPRAEPPLPLWARTTIDSLPATTLVQLELDALHRTANPLGNELSARIRWTVADANRCAYAKQSAELDLAKAGVDADESRLDGASRAALAFARRLTLASASITDEEVADLVAQFGPDDVVGIVHTVAFANFQDRLFLALGLTEEPGGAKPPLRTKASPNDPYPVPERSQPSDVGASSAKAADGPTNWSSRTFEELKERVEQQKSRTPRVPEPDAARLARFPRPDREQISRTVWGRISRGYQPVLGFGWADSMRAFAREASLDPVFENSLFWVVTRTNDCFY